jgi:pimeloyl-ACP methyl ester carboxylesterase
VVIVHGTPGKKEDVKAVAKFYLKNWVALAEKRGVILIAPVFDQENFASQNGDAVLGGYRGLFGRQIGADVFVMQIVSQYLRLFQVTDSQFYLYGHSAGGQFVAHFIVRHPERVKRAVISAALIYPYPDSAVAWPYGMGKLQTTIRWHESEPAVALDINPDPQGWVAASTLPVTVVVGLNDTEPQLDWPGQQGRNRLVIAQNWVRAMQQLAAQHGREATIELSMIPGLGHSSLKLLPYCQKALLP